MVGNPVLETSLASHHLVSLVCLNIQCSSQSIDFIETVQSPWGVLLARNLTCVKIPPG